MSRDWTQEELQAASAAMKSAGFYSYEEFISAIEGLKKESAGAPGNYRYYIDRPHVSSDQVPEGFLNFQSWQSRPYCADAGKEYFGQVIYPRRLSAEERVIYHLVGPVF